MAYTTTRLKRGERWRTTPVIVRRGIRTLVATTIAASVLQILEFPVAVAQVTPPSKKTMKVLHKAPANSPTKQSNDNEADQLNEKWLSEFNKGATDKAADPATAKPTPATAQAISPATAPQVPVPAAAFSATDPGIHATAAQARAAASSATAPDPIQAPARPATASANPAAPASSSPSVAGTEDERNLSTSSSVSLPSAGSRAVVPGTVTFVKADSAAVAFNSMPGGATQPLFKDLTKAFAGFAANAGVAKVEMMRGRTTDGSTRLLYAAIGEGKDKKSYWWFSPPDQPDGWFDNSGHRLGGTMLSEPKPESRISSPFGRRRYYGRTSGAGFHNGIDFEGKVGDPIYAAADGVINHAGWYFNYGRTVKISHADNFETLYAHMSRFAAGIAPGTYVHQGDIIGYVGSTGRSTGPHLHFSTIVDGQFVDPAPYISENGGNTLLSSQGLVAFRQWQGEIRTAALAQSRKGGAISIQAPDPWSKNPFTPPHMPGHL